jgi:O-antigen/teichoic acid export membrane protein
VSAEAAAPAAVPAGKFRRWFKSKDPSFFFYLGARVLSGVLSIFTLRAVIAYVSREQYADWGYLSTLSSMLVPLVSLSLPQAMMRHYFDHKEDDHAAQRSLASTVFRIGLGANTLLVLGVAALFALGVQPLHFSLYFAAVTTATVLVNYFNYLTRTRNDYGLFFFNRLFEAVSFLALVTWATRSGVGAHGDQRLVWLTTCLALTSWFSVMLNTVYYHRQGLIRFFGAMLPWSEIRALLRYSWPLCITFFVGWALSSSDIYLLRKLSTKAETADYVFAVGIVGVVSIVSQSALLDWPRFFFKMMRDGAADRDRIVTNRAAYFLWLHVATIAGTRLIAAYAYELLGATAFTRGLDYLGYLLLGNFFFLAGNLFSAGLGYAKRTHLTLAGFVIPGALNFGVNLWLIPRYGALAAAVTTVGAYLLFAGLMLVFGRASYRFTGGLRFAAVTAAAVFVALVRLPH